VPFKSQAQRKKFYAMANRGEISRGTVKEWEDATPKGKKLPEHVKKSHLLGAAAALERFGFKQAAEELRLKIPARRFHGYEAAHKAESERGAKKADAEGTADNLAELLEQINVPGSPDQQLAGKDPLDRSTAWGAPSNLAGGDTASRLSDMGQNNGFGGV
jgi:hypothetical protein